jgi:hypothetical protein
MSLARPWLKGQENGGVVRSRPCGRKIKDGREVVARGLADTEPAACEQANEGQGLSWKENQDEAYQYQQRIAAVLRLVAR